MRIVHSAVASPIYEFAGTFELDIRLGDELISMRIELFRNSVEKDHFRCHVWELEMFQLIPTLPRNKNNEPAHICDDVLMVDRGIPRSHIPYPEQDIVAPNVNAALEIVLNDLKQFLEHST